MKYPDLDEFARLLSRCPPRPANREKRRQLKMRINPIFRHRADGGAGYAPLVEYYCKRVDKVIREVRGTEVREGVMIWKLHSSGVVFKTPETVFAIDVIDSVVRCNADSADLNANDLLMQQDVWDRPPEDTPALMTMTARQRKQLAGLIRYAFYTHSHRDHVSWDLPRRIAEAGNTVIVTPGIRAAWEKYDFAKSLAVPRHCDSLRRDPHLPEFGPLRVRVHQGYQAHNRGWVTPCNAYLITTDSGVDVFARGDTTDTGLHGWLRRAESFGAKIDLYVGNLLTGGLVEDITRAFDCFLMPGHDWDMVHGPPRPGTRLWRVGPWAGFDEDLEWHWVRNRCEHLTWGERYHFVPRRDAPEGAISLACADNEVAGFASAGVDGVFGRGETCECETAGRWQWRGRTLEARPPRRGGSVYGRYAVDLRSAGPKPALRVGLALARQQASAAGAAYVLRVKVADGWADVPRVLAERTCTSQEPRYVTVPLDDCRSKSTHVILEVEAPAKGPVAWLLNPIIASESSPPAP